MCTYTAHKLRILVHILKHWAQYTSQFKMQIYAIYSTADNVLFQLRYLFDFTLFVFSHQWDSFGECLNWMKHIKCHLDYKSFMTPQANKSVKSSHTAPGCIRTKIFSELLKSFEYFAVLQIFLHGSYKISTCSQLQCMYIPKQAEKWLQVRETFHD